MKRQQFETALEKLSRILSREYGVQVIFHGTRCYTDGRTIHLPSIPDDMPEGLLDAIRGHCDHEISHLLFTEFGLTGELVAKYGQKGFDLANIIEDTRVNRQMAQKYIGAGENIQRAHSWVLDKLQREGVDDLSGWRKLTFALLFRLEGWDGAVFGEEANRALGRLKEEVEEAKQVKSTRESVALAARMAEKLLPQSPEQEMEDQAEDAPDGDDNHEGVSNDKESCQDEDSNVVDKNASGGIDEQEDDDNDSPGAIFSGAYEEEEASVEAFLKECDQDDIPATDQSLLTRLIESEVQNTSVSEGKYRVWSREEDIIEKVNDTDETRYRKLLQEVRPYISGLRQKLLLTLKARNQKRWVGDQERGAVNPRRLHRLMGDTSHRVFRIRHETDVQDTAVTLLIDCSYSMAGRKIRLARQLAIIFAESLDQLNIPNEIIGFSTAEGYDPTAHLEQTAKETGWTEDQVMERFSRLEPLHLAIYKEFHEPFKLVKARLACIRAHSCTPLAESLLFAARRLSRKSHERKVLLALTDGEPALHNYRAEPVHFKECERVVKKIIPAGIEPVGIGILTSSVAKIFPQHLVVNDLEDLPGSFYRKLSGVLGV